MQKYNATVISTTGAPGTGKTYSRCARFLYDWWLPEEKGVHWSNFPVNVEAFAKKYPDAAERIRIIPADELKAWALCDAQRGPWDFFAEEDLQGAHIAIDECHNYLRRNGKGSQINADRWQRWLGEIRHRGCTVEFLSQDPHKVHAVVEQHSAVRIQLVNSEDRRDPIFGCLLGDWYELRAALSGDYETVIWQLEERRINGKWVQSEMSRFTLEPDYFALYDSFNTPQSGGGKATGQNREFEKRGRVGLFAWFLKRNWWRFATRFAVAGFLVWICFLGGLTHVLDHFNEFVKARSTAGGAAPAAAPVDLDKKLEGEKAAAATVEKKKPTRQVVVPAETVTEPEKPAAVQVVRSETLRHTSLETPPSAEKQQAALPRLLLLAPEYVGLDDGQFFSVGERVGEFALVEIQYKKRIAVFEGERDGAEKFLLRVPVGGPVGVRVSKKSGDDAKGGGGISGFIPAIKPADETRD